MTFFEEFCYLNSSSIRKSITLMFISSSKNKHPFIAKLGNRCFSVVSIRHVGAHPDELQHGVSIQSSINLGKHFHGYLEYELFLRAKSWRGSLYYVPLIISQILDFICRMVLIFISIYFEWRDTENQQYRM